MAGGNHQKPSTTKPSAAAAANHRKPHRETTTTTNNHHKPSPSNTKPSPSIKHKPSPNPNPNPNQPQHFAPPQTPVPPPPPPAYGFHMLDRRTIVLADGTARSYFALPPDYRDFAPLPIRPPQGPEAWAGFDHNRQNEFLALESGRKRKFVGDERDEGVNDGFARQRQQLLQYGNSGANNVSGAGSSSGGGKHMRFNEVDEKKVKSAFLNFIRVVNENANQKRKYLADGKAGPVPCLACGNGRSSKDFPDMHSLIMHAYNPEKVTSDLVPDHLGLHKALCILMGWNYMMPPDNSKAYQRLPAEQAAMDRDDLIMWPPHVIIHNTITGKGRDGRVEGLGNIAMEAKLRDFGFTTGKPKSRYSREGHMGTTVVKFASDPSGLKDAMRLADFFEKQKHGRTSWASIESSFRPGKDDEKDPNFVKLDKRTGEKERILYGYLGTVFDLEGVDFDTRKKVTIESKREKAQPR